MISNQIVFEYLCAGSDSTLRDYSPVSGSGKQRALAGIFPDILSHAFCLMVAYLSSRWGWLRLEVNLALGGRFELPTGQARLRTAARVEGMASVRNNRYQFTVVIGKGTGVDRKRCFLPGTSGPISLEGGGWAPHLLISRELLSPRPALWLCVDDQITIATLCRQVDALATEMATYSYGATPRWLEITPTIYSSDQDHLAITSEATDR